MFKIEIYASKACNKLIQYSINKKILFTLNCLFITQTTPTSSKSIMSYKKIYAQSTPK